MIKIKKLVLLLLGLIFVFAGCSKRLTTSGQTISNPNIKLAPKEVVQAYFNYCNKKDVYKVNSLFTKEYINQMKQNNFRIDFSDLEYMKVTNLEEITDNNIRQGYSLHGPGLARNIKDENFKMFKVIYTAKDKNGNPIQYNEEMTVIKETPESPWLIDEFGQE